MQRHKLGIGTWQIGGPVNVIGHNTGWNAVSDAEAIEILRYCYSTGVDFFDTADSYGMGKSETLLGQAFANNADVIICSKVGWIPKGNELVQDFSPERIPSALAGTLERLQRSSINYYLLHNPPLAAITPQLLNTLNKLKEEGKILKFGISVGFLQPYMQFADAFDAFEVAYNEISPNNLALLPQLTGKDVFARSIYAYGLLLKTSEQLQPSLYNDWRRNVDIKFWDAARDYIEKHPTETPKSLLEKAMAQPFNRTIIGISDIKQARSLLA